MFKVFTPNFFISFLFWVVLNGTVQAAVLTDISFNLTSPIFEKMYPYCWEVAVKLYEQVDALCRAGDRRKCVSSYQMDFERQVANCQSIGEIFTMSLNTHLATFFPQKDEITDVILPAIGSLAPQEATALENFFSNAQFSGFDINPDQVQTSQKQLFGRERFHIETGNYGDEKLWTDIAKRTDFKQPVILTMHPFVRRLTRSREIIIDQALLTMLQSIKKHCPKNTKLIYILKSMDEVRLVNQALVDNNFVIQKDLKPNPLALDDISSLDSMEQYACSADRSRGKACSLRSILTKGWHLVQKLRDSFTQNFDMERRYHYFILGEQ